MWAGLLRQVVFTGEHKTGNRLVQAPTYGRAVIPPVRGHRDLRKTEVDRYPTTRSRCRVHGNHGYRGCLTRWCSRRSWRGGRGGRATGQDRGHSDNRYYPELAGRGHQAARTESKMVLAAMPSQGFIDGHAGFDVAHPGGTSQGPLGTPESVKSVAGAVGCSLTSLALVHEYPTNPSPVQLTRCPSCIRHQVPSSSWTHAKRPKLDGSEWTARDARGGMASRAGLSDIKAIPGR